MRHLAYNVRHSVVPINSSLLTITLYSSVIATQHIQSLSWHHNSIGLQFLFQPHKTIDASNYGLCSKHSSMYLYAPLFLPYKTLHIDHTLCLYISYIHNNYFSKQHWPVGLCNDGLRFTWGRNCCYTLFGWNLLDLQGKAHLHLFLTLTHSLP